MGGNSYTDGLERNPANHVMLSPLSFLRRTALVYPERIAVIHGDLRRTWAEFYTRCRRLASALVRHGVGCGDTVAVMAPNIPEFLEAHFGVPMAGAVLNSLNIRLDAPALRFMLEHGEAKVLLTDREFSPVIKDALAGMGRPPLVIDIDDALAQGGELLGAMTYEAFLAGGDPRFDWQLPADEWQAIALNYTSGTTGDPKGVVYHHRGAYLNAMGNALTWAMPHFPVYLWTLPMFHCNGWCFTWTMAAVAGTHVCLRKVDGVAVLKAIETHHVTHLCGAPIVMTTIINAAGQQQPKWPQKVSMMTAGAAPPAAVIERMEALGIEVVHVYGLTETYGPCVVCAWHPEWDELESGARAAMKSRQGVVYDVQEEMIVATPDSIDAVPADGRTLGEILVRGNIVMKGYLKNASATAKAFQDGWFHTGDLAVRHENGYVEIRDRSKDIIISGGENISSIEVEGAIYKHPAVQAVAVVAKPDAKWGETPVAFVELKSGTQANEAEIVAWCRDHLAKFKCPRQVIFTELPKTATGKIQKFVLRERAKTLS